MYISHIASGRRYLYNPVHTERQRRMCGGLWTTLIRRLEDATSVFRCLFRHGNLSSKVASSRRSFGEHCPPRTSSAFATYVRGYRDSVFQTRYDWYTPTVDVFIKSSLQTSEEPCFCPFRASNTDSCVTQGAAALCPGLWALRPCPFRAFSYPELGNKYTMMSFSHAKQLACTPENQQPNSRRLSNIKGKIHFFINFKILHQERKSSNEACYTVEYTPMNGVRGVLKIV